MFSEGRVNKKIRPDLQFLFCIFFYTHIQKKHTQISTISLITFYLRHSYMHFRMFKIYSDLVRSDIIKSNCIHRVADKFSRLLFYFYRYPVATILILDCNRIRNNKTFIICIQIKLMEDISCAVPKSSANQSILDADPSVVHLFVISGKYQMRPSIAWYIELSGIV